MNVIIKIEGHSGSLGPLPRSRGVVHFFVHIKPTPRARHFTPRLLFLIDFPDTRGGTPSVMQPQPQGLIVETGNGASVLQLPATTLEQIRHIAADPGASTLRLPPPATEPLAGAHELDFDLCYVCKHCKVAFPTPAPLQAHQARSCYAGREAARGVIRVVQPALECRTCPGERFRTALEFRRHAETDAHRGAVPPAPPPELTHEMEDVVNQITLLAARAAQETPKDPGTNFCAPSPRFPPSELPLASAVERSSSPAGAGHPPATIGLSPRALRLALIPRSPRACPAHASRVPRRRDDTA
ncbi:unnamed protein product [Chilo suppressalis]|uniref:C2H2-type domain-containing protein n=1 Tax=Chilo suppressalis TaxID=168631 RepID=A0ABN8AVB1_CHISP|nr:unnamed protein product [Chilo suppressalis]